jgi:hypothetical protein
VLVGFSAFALPNAVGAALLGESWSVVRPLLPITSVEYAALAWLSAANAGILVRGGSHDLLAVRAVFALCALVLGTLSAAVARTPEAVAMALAASAIVASVFAYRVLVRHNDPLSDSRH